MSRGFESLSGHVFDRGPHGYLFEYTIWDDVTAIILGTAAFLYGIWLILFRPEKFSHMAPIMGMFLMCGGVIPPIEVMYLLNR